MELLEKETPEFIPPQLWPLSSPDFDSVDRRMWVLRNAAKEGVQNTHHQSGQLKYQLRTEWAKLDHIIMAAAIHQWHRRLPVCVKADGEHFEHHL